MLEQHERPSATRLQTFAIWAEIVAAVAVVVSLVFVGLQIQQGTAETVLNTRAAEEAAYQDLQAQLTVVTTVQIEQPELRRVMSRVHGGEALDEDDQRGSPPCSPPPCRGAEQFSGPIHLGVDGR